VAVTDADGRFVLGGLPAGTQSVEVRHLGFLPARRTVDLRDRDTTRATIALTGARVLSTVTVTGTRTPSARVAEAVERHRNGFGRLVMGEALERAPQLRSVLSAIPGVRIYQVPPKPYVPQGISAEPGSWLVLMPMGAGTCVARIFIDGRETDSNEMMTLHPGSLRAVEVFRGPAGLPAFAQQTSRFTDGNCGTVILWTVAAP
jgi:hypothetical protein